MNYIKQLKSDNFQLASQVNEADIAIHEFRKHLQINKYKGFEEDGSRKDWISTADVDIWLLRIRDSLLNLNN